MEPSGSFQLIGHHLYLSYLPGVGDMGIVRVWLKWPSLWQYLRHSPLPSSAFISSPQLIWDLVFPSLWNNCPIYLSLKIDQDLVTCQPTSRLLLEISLSFSDQPGPQIGRTTQSVSIRQLVWTAFCKSTWNLSLLIPIIRLPDKIQDAQFNLNFR